MATNIVDICRVSPSEALPAALLLPLLHCDIIWLPFDHTKYLFFYDFKCSQSLFLNNIVPTLKNSLSLTLKHFPPLAGKIVVPLTSGRPVSRYVAGDSVALTIAQSGADFARLTGHGQFHDFVSQIPPPTYSSRFVELPVAAIQVTLFPNKGISVGFNLHHAIGDGAAIFRFIHAWASINKFNGDVHLVALGEKFLPFYDRSVVQDADRLAAVCWNNMKIAWPASPPAISSPEYVQAKFLLSEAVLKKLKIIATNNKEPAAAPRGISSFVAVTAYLWSCAAMSAAASGETLADDEPEYFFFPTDSRARLNPPLPDTYFGNCLTHVLVELTHGALKGNGGFVAAAEAIAEAVRKVVNSDWGSLDGSENLLKELGNLAGKRTLAVAGSPTFDNYGVDYGWGRPKMFTFLTTKLVSICRSKDGGVEIAWWMPKLKMEAFAATFNQGLRDAAENLPMRSSL